MFVDFRGVGNGDLVMHRLYNITVLLCLGSFLLYLVTLMWLVSFFLEAICG